MRNNSVDLHDPEGSNPSLSSAVSPRTESGRFRADAPEPAPGHNRVTSARENTGLAHPRGAPREGVRSAPQDAPRAPRAPAEIDHPHDAETYAVIGCAIAVHRALGPGLSSHIYRRALAVELHKQGHAVVEEHAVEVSYRGVVVGSHRLDLLARVDGVPIVVEVKHFPAGDVERQRVGLAQLQNYLALARVRVGLLLNFGGAVLGKTRVVNPRMREGAGAVASPVSEVSAPHRHRASEGEPT